MSEPRVIRRVSKTYKDGTPRVARDRKLGVEVTRAKAHTWHTCANKKCPWTNREIESGTHYVACPIDGVMFVQGRRVQRTGKYHPDCAPKEFRPLIRILFGMPWQATTVTGPHRKDDVRFFTRKEAWEVWVDKHFPDMRREFDRADGFKGLAHDPRAYQVGTNYYYSFLCWVARTSPTPDKM